ncbi:uncharacterized protein I206_107749 [Kwoniella pini CBS 10737]|uniref:Uncharacterized protein n=1 Tax=Kwoniella pini CBS 10737 TaxID=1296096 RepID=A0A1B9HY71_9TREE|nr:uncharacterized protein I206_06082 [Kwoniella pini CBS 10737]OCF48214.1 hypothetical protein I206_06082 [Kwoniella pini CBS 10737]
MADQNHWNYSDYCGSLGSPYVSPTIRDPGGTGYDITVHYDKQTRTQDLTGVPVSYAPVPSIELSDNQRNTISVLWTAASQSELPEDKRRSLCSQFRSLWLGQIPRKKVTWNNSWSNWAISQLPIVDTNSYTTRQVTKIDLMEGVDNLVPGGKNGEHGQNVKAINEKVRKLDEEAGHPVWGAK